MTAEVRIVDFPETRVAVLEHRSPPELENLSVRKLVEWRMANRLHPDRHRSYGVHYNDPRKVPAADYRVDLCISVENEIAPNSHGIVNKVIPGGRCAVARHVGPRDNISTAYFLNDVWFPASGETLRDYPIFFHYVNVGPQIVPADMITDVYLPLK